MKFYFLNETHVALAEYTNVADEPAHIAAFDWEEGQSKFTPRYALEDGEMVDKFPGKTDEEVATALQAAEVAEAARLAALHAQ